MKADVDETSCKDPPSCAGGRSMLEGETIMRMLSTDRTSFIVPALSVLYGVGTAVCVRGRGVAVAGGPLCEACGTGRE